MSTNKEMVERELEKLIKIRTDFYDIFDQNIPKSAEGGFEFEKVPSLPSKQMYENFYKLDYQARKLRGLLVEAYGLKGE